MLPRGDAFSSRELKDDQQGQRPQSSSGSRSAAGAPETKSHMQGLQRGPHAEDHALARH